MLIMDTRPITVDEINASTAHMPVIPPADVAGFVSMDLVFEGADTHEGTWVRRRFTAGALTTRPLPLTIFDQPENAGHYAAKAVGAMTRLWREDRGGGTTVIRAVGWINGSEAGARALHAIQTGERSFLSVDPIWHEYHYSTEETTSTETHKVYVYDFDADEIVDVEKTFKVQREVYEVTDGTIYAGTMLSVAGAFAGATQTVISAEEYAAWQLKALPDLAVINDATLPSAETIIASGIVADGTTITIPRDPAFEDFYVPEAGKLTKVVVDGHRVFGHLAGWDMCHAGCDSHCLRPPRPANYSKFHRTPRPVADGRRVMTGPITLGTRHSRATEPSIDEKIRHHENTGTAVADVRIIEGRFGPWMSGVLRASVTPAQVEQLMMSHPSGEWLSGHLHNVLMVNSPGFGVVEASDSDGVVTASCGGACSRCQCQQASVEYTEAADSDTVDAGAIADALKARRALAARRLVSLASDGNGPSST